MALAYTIALWMDWGNPFWAGLAIANCSLTTFGESINKAILRLGGTAVAILFSVLLISFFQQERWIFVATIGAWIALCNYMMIGNSRFYFWQVAGFVTIILVVDGGNTPVSDFDIFVLRAKQTVLGVVCFSVVYSLLWPGSSRERFENQVRECLSLQRKLVASALDSLSGKGKSEDFSAIFLQATQQFAQLKSLLEAASLDSFAVWDRRKVWRRLILDLTSTEQEVRRLCLTLGDLNEGQPAEEIQSLRGALEELDARLDDTLKLLANRDPRAKSLPVDIAPSDKPRQDLSHFQRAAISVSGHHARLALNHAEVVKAEAADLRDYPSAADYLNLHGANQRKVTLTKRRFFDPDTWILILRNQVIFFLAVMCSFYVPGYPSAPLLLCISVSVPMALLTMPQISVAVVLVPIFVAVAAFGSLHIFLMPKFTTFEQLISMLFVATFIVAYFTTRPDQALLRIIGTNVMVVGLQINNEQHYSFLFYAIVMVGVITILAIIETTRYFPFSMKPEHRVEAMLKRFFASVDYVIRHSTGTKQPKPDWFKQWLLGYHRAEIDTIPRKLIPWLNAIPPTARKAPTHGNAVHVAASLEALTDRITDLTAARRIDQAEPLLAGGSEALQSWRLAVADVASTLTSDPGSAETSSLEARLNQGIVALEETVERVINETSEEKLNPVDFENMYRALGAYRGVAEAIVDYARRATAIDWQKLREPRF